MYSFIKLFQYITKSKSNSINYIFTRYNKKHLGIVLDIYLIINKFRNATLVKLDIFDKINLFELENMYNIKIYNIISKHTNIYLVTNDITKKSKNVANGYEKYVYGKVQNNKLFNHYQTEIGKLLEYFTPFKYKSKNTIIDSITYKIYYNDILLSSDIYGPQSLYNFPNYTKIKNKNKKLQELLKKISKKIYFDMVIKYK